MPSDSFMKRSQGRRPRTYMALGVGMAAAYAAVKYDLGALTLGLAIVYLALVLRRLILNPATGFRLGQTRIDWFTEKGTESAALADLIGVTIARNPEGRTVCTLKLRGGRAITLSGVEDLDPKRLIREFMRRGIPTQAC